MKVSATLREIEDIGGNKLLRQLFLLKNWTPKEQAKRWDDFFKGVRRYTSITVRGRKILREYYPQPNGEHEPFSWKLAVLIDHVFKVPLPDTEKMNRYIACVPTLLDSTTVELADEEAARLEILPQ